MGLQRDYLDQLKIIANENPVLCAGDVFDKWNAPPELVNFALKYLPDDMVCVPGQHDLPNHRTDAMYRSGYGVLMTAGKIQNASGKETDNLGSLVVHGFGWEQPIKPSRKNTFMNVALIHRYCWKKGCGYPDAPLGGFFHHYRKQLKGYHVAVFGDNHIPFEARAGNCLVFNCGCFIRRKMNEISHRPSVGLLFNDGTVERKFLDCSRDKFHKNVACKEQDEVDLKNFLRKLNELGEQALDYSEVVKRHLRQEGIASRTKEIIREAMIEP